jgi:DNA-binding transcriptional LysR family regulator
MLDEAFRAAVVDYRAALETEGWEVMKHYVALGFGIAIVNDLCLKHSVPPDVVSRPLADLFPERVYRAIWAKKRRLPEPATRFLTHLRERAAQDRS